MTPIIGMEIHVELATASKMFCGCPADHFGKSPNTQTCPVCLGLPGALPIPNAKAIDWTVLIGLALGAHINLESKFDRKHYFSPDLPKGYQISQYDEPLCEGGQIETSTGTVGITRVHLEEDTGKLQHTTLDGQKVSLIDFNRSGVPLVEIVSEPDIHSASQAKEYAKQLSGIIRSLGVSDCDMEKGSMRLEANISWGLDLNYKVEVKNINSFRFLEKAIDYELKRQQAILNKGDTPTQETRGFNESKNATFSQRSKEGAEDYRYFPEPDIPPLHLTQQYVDDLKSTLPKLPEQIKAEWVRKYHLKDNYATVLIRDQQTRTFASELFVKAKEKGLDLNLLAGMIVNKKVDLSTLTPPQLINQVLTQKYSQVSDTGQLTTWVNQAITDNPSAVADYKTGKEASLQFLMGQVMKLSTGEAHPQQVIKLLQDKLS